jgi:hypothetical protein
MGLETANVHLGSRTAAKTILKDLRSRQHLWLHRAAAGMVKATTEDWERWREHWHSSKRKPGDAGAV